MTYMRWGRIKGFVAVLEVWEASEKKGCRSWGMVRILLLGLGFLRARIIRFTVHLRVPSPGMREPDTNSVCWDHGAARAMAYFRVRHLLLSECHASGAQVGCRNGGHVR